jgi:hypothetical protein
MKTYAYGSVREIMDMCRKGSSNSAGSVRSILLLLMVGERKYCNWAQKHSKLWVYRGNKIFIVKEFAILG